MFTNETFFDARYQFIHRSSLITVPLGPADNDDEIDEAEGDHIEEGQGTDKAATKIVGDSLDEGKKMGNDGAAIALSSSASSSEIRSDDPLPPTPSSSSSDLMGAVTRGK